MSAECKARRGTESRGVRRGMMHHARRGLNESGSCRQRLSACWLRGLPEGDEGACDRMGLPEPKPAEDGWYTGRINRSLVLDSSYGLCQLKLAAVPAVLAGFSQLQLTCRRALASGSMAGIIRQRLFGDLSFGSRRALASGSMTGMIRQRLFGDLSFGSRRALASGSMAGIIRQRLFGNLSFGSRRALASGSMAGMIRQRLFGDLSFGSQWTFSHRWHEREYQSKRSCISLLSPQSSALSPSFLSALGSRFSSL